VFSWLKWWSICDGTSFPTIPTSWSVCILIISAHSYLPIALDFPFWQLSILHPQSSIPSISEPSSFFQLCFCLGFGFGFDGVIVVITIKKHFANSLTTCSPRCWMGSRCVLLSTNLAYQLLGEWLQSETHLHFS